MRKFTFGTFAIGHGTNYNIESVEGIGTPGIEFQDQKAPYQDGSTYIDNLLDVREIVIEGAIVAAGFSAINTARDAMMRGLNPKNGEAWLQYDSDGVSKRIKAVGVVTFSNKQYQDAFQRFQITFRCSDPLWQDLTGSTISLPTSTNSAEAVINASASNYPTMIKKSNGNLFIAYVRNSDGYLVSREYTTSWSAESVITTTSVVNPCVIQKQNGDLFLVYSLAAGGAVNSQEYTSSWSSPSSISSAVGYPSVIQKTNGNLFLIYSSSASGSKIVYREYTSSWSGEVIISGESCDFCCLTQLSNGGIYIAYRKTSGAGVYGKILNTSLGSEITINSINSYPFAIAEYDNGVISIMYLRVSDNYMCKKDYLNSWSTESVIVNSSSDYSSIVIIDNSTIKVSYRRSSDDYIVLTTRSVTPVNAEVTGHVNTPISVTLNGPSTNPRIINNDTLEYIRLNKTLATGDYFVVNTEFGKKSIELWSGGIKTNGLAFLDLGSTLFDIAPGDNTVYYEDDSVASTATATMTWTERYIGV